MKGFFKGSDCRFCRGPDHLRGRGLLLREVDQRYRLAEQAACLHDPRNPARVRHDLLTLVRRRLCVIALGYEDNNDAATLAKDPAFKIMAGRAPEASEDLASQPILSRFDNRANAKDLRRLSDVLLKLFLKTPPGPPRSSSWVLSAPRFCRPRRLSPGRSAAPRQHPRLPRGAGGA